MLVSISKVHGWTAYVFEDTFYPLREPTTYRDAFCSNASSYYPDSLSCGQLDSTCYLEPRIYFLSVFEVRIDKAYTEWRGVVDILEEVVKR